MSFLLNSFKSFPPSGGFVPSDIPGLRVWFDAQDAAQLALTGSNVDTWNSKSGAVTLGLSSTGSNRPTTDTVAGKQMIRFNNSGGGQWLSNGVSTTLSPGTGAFSIWVISRGTDTARATVVANGPTGTAQSVFMRYNNGVSDGHVVAQWRDSAPGVNRTLFNDSSVNHADGSVRVHYFGRQVSAGNSVLFTDNVASPGNPYSDTSGNINDNMGNMWMGRNGSGTDKFNGHIGEVLIYFHEFTATERDDLHTYLKAKWGL